MAAPNFTPISLYYTTVSGRPVPAGTLVNGELALNAADGTLFYYNTTSLSIQEIKAVAQPGGSTTQVQYNNAGVMAGSANMTFNGTSLTLANVLNAPSVNGATTLTLATGGTTAVTVDASQNVGIGTGTPAYRLDVNNISGDVCARVVSPNANYVTFRLKNNAQDYSMQIRTDVSNAWVLRDETSGANRMAVDTSGHVLIGTTTASGSALLQVNSDALINSMTVGLGGSAVATNTAVGYQSLITNGVGNSNTALGIYTLLSNTSGSNNTAIGGSALATNLTGSHNSGFGLSALYLNSAGSYNTAVGETALYSNTASNNTAVGYQAAYSSSTSGDHNTTAIGYQALYSANNTTYGINTAVGYQAGYGITTGYSNVCVGDGTMGTSGATGTFNAAFGSSALNKVTSGTYNVAFGASALYSNTTASNNTAVGYQAGFTNSTGSGLVAIGDHALYTNADGAASVVIGHYAGYASNASGAVGNTLIGTQAGYSLTSGIQNTFIGSYNGGSGYGSGHLVTTGSNNTIVGNFPGNQGGLDIRTASNYIVLSDGAGNPRQIIDNNGAVGINCNPVSVYQLQVASQTNTSGSYPLVAANSSGTALFYVRGDGLVNTGSSTISPYNNTTAAAANVTVDSTGSLYRSTSSLKYKTDVQDATHGLEDLIKLRSVTYKGINDGDTVFGGLIAEEVDAAGLTEFVQYAEDGTPDALAYGNMVSLCIKAIQEQQALIETLTTRLTAAEEQIIALGVK